MKLFLHIDPNTIAESHTAPSPKVQLDEIDALADTLEANMGKEVKVPKDVLDSFKIKDSLNHEIWNQDELNPEVRAKLIQVALDFYKDLELPEKVKIKDIIFTGSLANFNWSKFSDIDLHIVIDFNEFNADPKFVEDYFYAQKSIWNQEHDIKIFNYPIELYVQDINDKLVATAVYSVLKNKWLKKPTRESFKLDKTAIKSKAESFIHKLRDIKQDYADKDYKAVVDKVKKLKDRIKNMRNSGLERGGEFSLENLVFKTLRRTPFMDILDSYKAKAYDNLMSVSEVQLTEAPQPTKYTQPSEEDIKKIFYTGDGFFNFEHANYFAQKYLGFKLVKTVGFGGNGAAYLTSKGTKLKFTFNENEYYFAKRSVGKDAPYMANYFLAENINDDIFVIEMEFLKALPSGMKTKLAQMFDALRKHDDNYDKEIKNSVDFIKSKIGVFANDLFNPDNYGIKNGHLATFDPVSEQDLHEGDVLDNTKFKYKRDEDAVKISAIWDNQVIGFISLETITGGYWYFEGNIPEEKYDELFPNDKYMLISHLEISDKMFRGEGVAKELVNRAIKKAKQQGFDRIALNASPMGTDGLQLNDLVRFYKSLGFTSFLNQGNNHLMILALDNTKLTEADNLYNQGGVLLIKGAKLEDGTQRLYITTINNRLGLDRFKKDMSKGQAAKMAVLGNQVYRLSIVDGKLKAQGVAWSSEQKQLEYLGLNRFSVGINNNKTPLHWETLKYNNIAQALHHISGQILNLPNIKW